MNVIDHMPGHRATLPLIAAALLGAAACSKKPQRQPRPTATVAVEGARRTSVPYVIEANGVVQPLQSVAVASQVDGIVTAVQFQEGEEVSAGQVLFQIDPRPYRAAYEQALAVLARDSATAANAKIELERYRKLVEARVVTPEEGEQHLASAAATEATVRADRAAVANARFNLDNTTIRAPISGKTGSLLVKRGNLVRAGGGTPLVIINQVRPILVRFAIPSSQLPLLLQYGARGGLPVAAVPGGMAPTTASADSATGALTPVGDPPAAGDGVSSGAGAQGGSASRMSPELQQGLASQPVMGKLSFIDNAVDTTTGTVQLKAVFANTGGTLWAGEFAATSLHLFDEQDALVVPSEAVVTGQRGTYVYVVDPSDTARQRPVTVERVAEGLAVIANGLRDGDRVVTEGQSRLTPNAPVRIRGAAEDAESSVAARRGGGRGRRGGPGAPGGRGVSGAADGAVAPGGARPPAGARTNPTQ